ncbi:uncharacterized protein LOC130051981 isoform X2 [Ostrea edulis]|uniref:uncharacterized protein LOC130051981 isoform X2 n=1 Tax=Ostrea edulis TaxID=37623 RepID=UPI0024AF2B7D|nr:uncharacterized protein LOC130051981 isoform X2 [Ostrea edulis]
MLRTFTFILSFWIYVALHKAAVLNGGRQGLRRGFLDSRLTHGPPPADPETTTITNKNDEFRNPSPHYQTHHNKASR